MGLKQKLRNLERSIGSWVTIGHPDVIEIMATAGFDWLTLDMEHTGMSLETARTLLSVMKSRGVQGLIRVAGNDEIIIKQSLDIGADGVIVPNLKSKEEALRAASFVQYPPKGRRGVGLYRAQNFGLGFEEYIQSLEEEIVLIGQIEHIDAVNSIDEILSVDAIDGFIIGPYDLSGSLGYPGEFHRKEVKEALARVLQACTEAKRALGFHSVPPDPSQLTEKFQEGYNFAAYSTDFFFLGEKARKDMEWIQTHLP
ncbi:2,4-dihydroxyhept-2-ene-1,7-dioic acid aldolase [bacterium]|nr:2,4-dihydroxyhept-2-ene-1,7-dioic acid aldolase [bacterium]